jgi:prephenate dehydrogenase
VTTGSAGQLFPRGVVIIGTGLIGTSIGLALRDRGIKVYLSDGDPRTAELAASLGAGELLGQPITRATATATTPAPNTSLTPRSSSATPAANDSAALAAGGADLAVLAVPPDAVAPVLAAAQAAGLAGCYTDVASVKAGPVAAARALGCDLASYVPGHPLAGRERSGPAAARADLFHGRPWALCPGPATAESAVACVTALIRACGAEPVPAGPDEHDRWVALISHAPHVVASAMAARLADAPPGALHLAGQGLRDVTRIAAGDTGLWTQILLANAAGVSGVLAAVAEDLRLAAAALAEAAPAGSAAGGAPGTGSGQDTEARKHLTALLDAGAGGVSRIPGKHSGPATAYAIVQVVIPDRPGELARLFQAAGAAGINIEDIRIEHSPGLPSGVAELAVKPAVAGPLAAALAARGWPAYPPARH